ncbi:hypothetical protein B5M42_004705 [Paenibacillus athensensis]|uniref:Uncharacterized protein n=1 Tax=Paenibacillus athensensis TaxID=1967502 RepID=A0A4Y8PSP6_9BACL|nr:hypothetical protein [Paenibacillus athensensis]MCD1258139.1 hypothetical protein [Paenibacillus athensensis]
MNKMLSSDAELLTAALLQRKINVIQRTADDIPVFVDAGTIEKYSSDIVKVNGTTYLRDESEFRLK